MTNSRYHIQAAKHQSKEKILEENKAERKPLYLQENKAENYQGLPVRDYASTKRIEIFKVLEKKITNLEFYVQQNDLSNEKEK